MRGATKKSSSGPAARKQRKRHKKDTKIGNDEEIERLSELIFSSEQTEKVEQELRKTLLDCKRIKSKDERLTFATHSLDASQSLNLKLLVTGFCRKFSFFSKRLL